MLGLSGSNIGWKIKRRRLNDGKTTSYIVTNLGICVSCFPLQKAATILEHGK